MKGLFITIEGGDGSGKSTQINLIEKYFVEKGYNVVLTREPGGTVIGEHIREIILNNDYMEMSDITEALLYAAARAQHVEQLIKPSINKEKIVICDRFVDSSIVYQGYARGIGIEEIENINNYATKGLKPDLTILLDLPAKMGLKRKKSQKQLDRLELQKIDFHEKVSKGYKALATKYKERILVIDATKSVDEIYSIIVNKLNELTTA